jgi:hypothetical protein
LFLSVGTSEGDAWVGYLLIIDGYLFALISVLRPVSSDCCLPVLNHHKRLYDAFMKRPRLELLGVASDGVFSIVQKTIRKFKSFAGGEKTDRDFYKNLSPQERLNILLKLSEHEPERRLEKVLSNY